MPEIDIPGHAASWGFGRPDIVVHCDGITEGQGLEESVNRVAMNPVRAETMDVVQRACNEVGSATRGVLTSTSWLPPYRRAD